MPILTRPASRRRGTPRRSGAHALAGRAVVPRATAPHATVAPRTVTSRTVTPHAIAPRALAAHAIAARALLVWLAAGGAASAGLGPGRLSPVAARAAAPPAAEAPFSLVPGIAFGWTDPATDALLTFQLTHVPAGIDQVTGLRLPDPHLTLAGYRVERASGKLLLRVRADRSGDVAVRRLQVELRYAPAQKLSLRAAEVVALPSGGGPLTLRRWASDDAVGLYAAFALVNEGEAAVTVHGLRYAPQRLGRGLVLVQTAPPGDFEAWKDRVLEHTEPAFAGYLRARGHDPRAPSRTPAPASLAFPLTGPLAGARWRASDALDATVAPGDALFLAITPAAFTTYVDDLAIDAYPVLAYEAGGGCCQLQGVGAPIVHVVDDRSAWMGGSRP